LDRRLLFVTGVLGFVAVATGAFGAHALALRVSAARLETWDTAVRYLFYHLPLLLMLGSGALGGGRAVRWSARCAVAGSGVFSGSLFLLVLLDLPWLGAVTPIGGLLLLCAWLAFLLALRERIA
jgi:uncharacterized membrane protein YgdD (TMEM256/DUF423 family)